MNVNVLKITSTPIKISMSSQRARLESSSPDPEAGIIQHPGQPAMRSENIKVNIDTSRSRDMGPRTARNPGQEAAVPGKKSAVDASAQYTRVGSQMMQLQDGVTVSDLMKSQMMAQANVTTGTGYIPSAAPDSVKLAEALDVHFTPAAQVEFRPQIEDPSVYVPGELKVNVEQYPKVEIEYIGEPLHIPPMTVSHEE